MPLLIKIVNQPFEGRPQCNMGGMSGIDYIFPYDKTVGAYCRLVDSQTEIDDIVEASHVPHFPWKFSFIPVVGGAPSPQAGVPGAPPTYKFVSTIPPYVKPELYAKYPAADLAELAVNCGFTAQGSLADSENVRRQLDAYMVGRAWAIEESKRLTEENNTLKAAAVPPPAPAPRPEAAIRQIDPAPPVAAEPAERPPTAGKRPRGRPRLPEPARDLDLV